MRVMLHACCGPCLLEPYRRLLAGHDITVVYANPNIQPREEYERRRDTLLAWTREQGIDVIELPYAAGEWNEAVRGVEADRERRCRACFRLRLGMVARLAAERGYDAVATTLTVSPYQDPAAIAEAGEAACVEAGVRWLATDYRDDYPEATSRSRELGMYRQNYCGCLFSRAEAEEDRERRRAQRATSERG